MEFDSVFVGLLLNIAGEAVCDDGLVASVGAFVAPHATHKLRMRPGCHALFIAQHSMGLMEFEKESAYARTISCLL
jgi:hypothetical protein